MYAETRCRPSCFQNVAMIIFRYLTDDEKCAKRVLTDAAALLGELVTNIFTFSGQKNDMLFKIVLYFE
jgi:hypothetical protein